MCLHDKSKFKNRTRRRVSIDSFFIHLSAFRNTFLAMASSDNSDMVSHEGERASEYSDGSVDGESLSGVMEMTEMFQNIVYGNKRKQIK
jgi:hypothetical protein